MKRIASILLILSLILCGCSEFSTDNELTEDTYSGSGIVSEEQEIPEEIDLSDENDTENEKVSSPTVYRTRSGEKYHRESCYYLKSKIEITLDTAKFNGLKPCSKCNPPQ